MTAKNRVSALEAQLDRCQFLQMGRGDELVALVLTIALATGTTATRPHARTGPIANTGAARATAIVGAVHAYDAASGWHYAVTLTGGGASGGGGVGEGGMAAPAGGGEGGNGHVTVTCASLAARHACWVAFSSCTTCQPEDSVGHAASSPTVLLASTLSGCSQLSSMTHALSSREKVR